MPFGRDTQKLITRLDGEVSRRAPHYLRGASNSNPNMRTRPVRVIATK